MAYLWLYLGLMFIILIHELGHYIAARKCGLHVETFSLGFGPALIQREWRGVTWRWALIPLGGYVKMPGMRPDSPDGDDPKAFWRAKKSHQAIVLLAGSFVNIVTGFLLLIIVLMWGFPQYKQNVRVSEPVGILHKGDQIITWNNEDARHPDFFPQTDKNACAQVQYKRQESMQTEKICNLEGKFTLERYGDRSYIGRNSRSPWEATKASADATSTLAIQTIKTIGQLVYKPEARKQVSSIVGITQFAPQADKGGYIVLYIVVLSLAIGVFNLLPILPLDGGHLTVVAYEKVRGQMSADMYGTFALVGWICIIALLFLGLRNDLT